MDSVKLNTYSLADYYSQYGKAGSQVRNTNQNTEAGKSPTAGSLSNQTSFAGAIADMVSLGSGNSGDVSSKTYSSYSFTGDQTVPSSSPPPGGPRPVDVASYATSLNDMTQNLVSAYDSDGDGGLSSSEVEKMGMASTDFSSIDTDGDAVLSTSELNSAKAGMDIKNMTNDLVAGKDKDGDGLLSSSEMGMQSDEFGGIDTDSDGKLSKDELNTTAYALFTKTLSNLQSASSAIAASTGTAGSSSSGVNLTA